MKGQYIVLFDGVCNFCNSSVNFIIDHDPKGKFKFAALQSEEGQTELKKQGYSLKEFNSIVLIKDGVAYDRSAAALRIVKELNGLYPLFYGFIIVPPFIRNIAYDYFARNRYKWFGKQDACRIPTPELKERFL